MFSDFLIAIGGNLPSHDVSRAGMLHSAVDFLRRGPGEVTAVSRFYSTPAFPAGSGPDFVNAALVYASEESPEEVLSRLHEIEQAHGRERKKRWGPRSLDMDLIACGDRVLPDGETFRKWHDLPLSEQLTHSPDRLILPHPRMHERAFVLVPLNDVASSWRHPVLGQTVTELLVSLPEAARSEVVLLPESACH